MFSKARNNRDASKSSVTTAAPSIVSTDMHITGNIVTTGEVHVDGKIEGNIVCKMLVIGPPGSVTGEVDAEIARIHGVMSGQLRAKSIFLANTARMIGDVTHESLAIEPGAVIDGRCHHIENGEKIRQVEAGENLMLTDSSRAENMKRSGKGKKNSDGETVEIPGTAAAAG